MSALVWPVTLLLATGLLCLTALRVWNGWIALRRAQLMQRRDRRKSPGLAPEARIEMADLKERLRKLEAIARGVDP